MLLTTLLLSIVSLVTGTATAGGSDLFKEAGQLKELGAYKDAEALYAAVLDDPTTGSELREPAHYNRGVCLEFLGRYDEALTNYARVVDSSRDRMLVRDALFRIAMVEALHADYSGARLRFRRLLRGATGPAEKARLRIQLGDLQLREGHPHRAAFQLRRAQRLLTLNSGPQQPWFAAQLQVALGDLFLLAASRTALRSQRPRRLVKLLAKRGALLERAQQHYVAAIELRQPTWVQGATLRLGRGLLATAAAMARLERRLAAGPGSSTELDSKHLAAWLSKQRPSMARKAHESFRLCLDVTTETGTSTRFRPDCETALDEFPMDLLIGPDAAP